MSSFTNFLNLFKWNPVDDSEEEFDIDKALNENWDKIDQKLQQHITDVNEEVDELENIVNTTKEAHKYIQQITTTTSGTMTIPAYYKVGQNVLDVYYNGERLIKASTSDTQGHYYEVGEQDAVSNQIQLTSDWEALAGDVFEFVIKGVYTNEATT
mgnify:CR=1 FL=1